MANADEIKANNNSLAAASAAVWAVVLLIAFFADRGQDIGRLGHLIGNAGGWPLFGSEGIIATLFGGSMAVLVGAAWFGLGSFVMRFMRTEQAEGHSHILELVMRTAVGAALWSLIFFMIGVAGGYNRGIAVVCLAVGIVLAVLGIGRIRDAKEESRVPEKAGSFDKILIFLIAIPLVLSLAAALAPPTAKDTLLYHFSVPKQFIVQGSSAFIEGNIASYLALGTEMHVVWAMLLGNFRDSGSAGSAAGVTIWIFFPLLLAAVFGVVRETGISRRWSLLAVLMVATVPTAYHVAASSYIDLALTLYILLAAYTLIRWWKTPDRTWLILTAIFSGAALSSKLTTLFVVAAFALVILMRARDAGKNDENTGRIALGGFAALLLAGVIASPWYLRTWAETGSPIFPFYMSIWKGEAVGWDVERSNLFQAMNAQYGGAEKTPLDHLLAPLNVSVSAQPEIAANFDGVLGTAFLIGLPLLIFTLWKIGSPIEVKIFSGVALIMFLFWLFSSQQLRYLLPILPLLAVGIAYAAERIADKRDALNKAVTFSIVFASAACIATSAAWFLQKAPLRVVLGGETRDEYLTRNLDYYPYYQWLNTETRPDEKVWLINMRRDSYNLERPYFSDYLFEEWTFRKMLWASKSITELRQKVKSETGADHILVRHEVLLNENTPLFDPDRTAAENDAKLRLAKQFLLGDTQVIRSDKKFSLIKVF